MHPTTREERHGFVIAFLLALTTIILGVCAVAHAEEVALPFASFDHYSTTLCLVNPTDDDVEVPALGLGFGSPNPEVAAFAVMRVPGWPHGGGGIETIDVPLGLVPYVEISDGYGVIVRVNPLHAITPGSVVQFQDLLCDGDFRTFLFVASPDGSAYKVTEYDGAKATGYFGDILAPGAVALPMVGASRVTLEPGGLSVGPFPVNDLYSFALISKRSTAGTLLVVEGSPVW